MLVRRGLKLLCVWVLASAVLPAVRLCADESASPKKAVVKTGRLIYKNEPRRSLTVYYPDGWKPTDKRPALVIFRCNIPVQREHFRKLGMVIIKPQLANVNSGKLPGMSLEEIAKLPKPRHQVEDTKSAIRFIRKHASQLGIDPHRIVATGTSGGGDLALQAFLNRSFTDARDDRTVSPRPDALVLYCPAFDGINIWFVKMAPLIRDTKTGAPSFLPLLKSFIRNTTDEYATPLNHRADLLKLAATLGKEKSVDPAEIKQFQNILGRFNKRDWQLLHPFADALKMSASRILPNEPFPPTLIMFGTRDHLYEHQMHFVKTAKVRGKQFELKIYQGAGHSFMMQPAFIPKSTQDVEAFLRKHKFLP